MKYCIIPEVLFGNLLTGRQLKIYMAIKSFADKEGNCFPSNETLSKLTNINANKIPEIITALEVLGLLRITRIRFKVNMYRLSMDINNPFLDRTPKMGAREETHRTPKMGARQNDENRSSAPVISEVANKTPRTPKMGAREETPKISPKANETASPEILSRTPKMGAQSINYTKDLTIPTYKLDSSETPNTTRHKKGTEFDAIAAEIIGYLNNVAGKRFTVRPDNIKHATKLLKDGFTSDDLKKVVDIKTSQWKNDQKFSRYLRPSTLFGGKFESYLNERGTTYAQQTQGTGAKSNRYGEAKASINNAIETIATRSKTIDGESKRILP